MTNQAGGRCGSGLRCKWWEFVSALHFPSPYMCSRMGHCKLELDLIHGNHLNLNQGNTFDAAVHDQQQQKTEYLFSEGVLLSWGIANETCELGSKSGSQSETRGRRDNDLRWWITYPPVAKWWVRRTFLPLESLYPTLDLWNSRRFFLWRREGIDWLSLQVTCACMSYPLHPTNYPQTLHLNIILCHKVSRDQGSRSSLVKQFCVRVSPKSVLKYVGQDCSHLKLWPG